jgi:Protein of unknown function (DUF2948)
MLRLCAQTAADVPIISALLQDALVMHRDIYFDRKAKRLVLLIQRYCWESDETRKRTRAALRFEYVEHLTQKSILDRPLDAVFSLLSLELIEENKFELIFSGTSGVRLTVETLDVVLEDIMDGWTTDLMPQH